MNTSMNKKGFSKAIFRFYKKLKWHYETLIMGSIRIPVDFGRKS